MSERTRHRRQSVRGFTSIWPLLIFVIGATVTGIVGIKVRAFEDNSLRKRVQDETAHLAGDLTRRLDSYGEVARTGGVMLTPRSDPRLEYDEWQRYVAGFGPLDAAARGIPGFIALHQAQLSVPSFANWKAPDWQFRLMRSDLAQPDAHLKMDNEQLAQEDIAMTAALAIDAGMPRLSPRIGPRLPAGQANAAALMIISPIYRDVVPPVDLRERRRAAAGLVLVVVDLDRLFRDLLIRAENIRGIQVYDGPALANPAASLFTFGESASVPDIDPQEISWGGRVLWLQASAQWPSGTTAHRARSNLTILVGSLATLLVTFLLGYQEALRQRTEIRAKEITLALRQSEEELRRSRDTLSYQVEERTRQLSFAKDVAERANQAKTEFLNNMSHELRTPLHAILSFASIGEKRAAEQNNDRLAGYFQKINVSGNRLLALIAQLLDLAKLESGKFELNRMPTDLVALLQGAADELAELAAAAGLTLSVSSDMDRAVALVDNPRMLQVIRNLLSNAIKFSPPGTGIDIRLEAARLPGAVAGGAGARTAYRIRVLDRGIGIPADELEAVFDKFYQSTKTRTGAGGTGLGLPICRELVHAHGGRIRAASRFGGGAEFEIVLPANIDTGSIPAARDTKEITGT